MSDPDTSSSISNAIQASVIVYVIVILIFIFSNNSKYINYIIYLGIPLIIYILIVITNVMGQYNGCKTVNIGKAFYYGLPGILLSWVGLFISYFSWCRTPIASVLGPLVINSANVRNSGLSQYTLEYVESISPAIKGAGYGFYLFFMTTFGVIIGNGFSALC